jgi:uncharacterized membrane-anchored protein YjiN (DUF445 family)
MSTENAGEGRLKAGAVLTEADMEKARQLRRVKFLATAFLIFCGLLLAGAKYIEHRHPALGYVAAFAEAAVIGGIADWYAVVALFRHPAGVPIPHTAIIPNNQQRIADNLGRFIENQFLAPEPIEAKLKEVDFAALVADWLADKQRSEALSRFVLQLMPQTFDALDASGLRSFLSRRIMDQINTVAVAPLAAEVLASFTHDRRHQKLLDEVLTAIAQILNDPASVEGIRDKIRNELPALFNLFRADTYLLGKLMGSALSFLEEVRADPDHALRGEFDKFVLKFIDDLRSSSDYAARAEQLKLDIMGRPQVREIAQNMWSSLKSYIDTDVRSPSSTLGGHLQRLLVDVGRQLARDPLIRAEMNRGFVVSLQTFVQSQKSGVSKFIADQVKSWDIDQLVRLIELNIGKDLQYIRFNGMIIGGLVGVALHAAKAYYFAN